MDEHVVVERIEASADATWAVLGAFGDDSWSPVRFTVEGEGVGAVRTVAMPGGAVVERCELLDHDRRELHYRILSGIFLPADDYVGRILVRPIDGEPDACELEWSATYEPTADPDQLRLDLDRFLRRTIRIVRRVVTSTT